MNIVAQNLKEYWILKDEMTNFKGFIFINEKSILIPIEPVVRGCEACQIRLPSLQKENYMKREEPSRIFQRVAADFLSYANREYLSCVDRASGWISICCLNKIDVST